MTRLLSDTSSEHSDGRVRRKHHKVWTGCINCKKRHVKCDETKPSCQRCAKAKLACSGYNPPKPRIFEMPEKSYITQAENKTVSADFKVIQWRPELASPTTVPRTLEIHHVWQQALLDAFLVTWLPDTLVREASKADEASLTVPLSAWPSVAWKMARRHENGLVAQSVLCLTLVVLGARTGDMSLMFEASQHYGQVLQQIRTQVVMLSKDGYSDEKADHAASLLAASFCCSQTEYILRSWSNGDRHLQGIESILQTCGPACLANEDTRRIFNDHCFLWTACSVVHRRRMADMPWRTAEIDSLRNVALGLVPLAERVASILADYDTTERSSISADALELPQRIANTITDIQEFRYMLDLRMPLVNSPLISGATSRVDPDLLTFAIARGATSAQLMHMVDTAFKLRSSDDSYVNDSAGLALLTGDQLEILCETHVQQLCHLVEEIAIERFGMVTGSPSIFFLDAAWLGYVTLATYCDHDISTVRPWFVEIGKRLSSTGYRPMREPWNEV
jgi:hypothetical protein